MFNSFYPNASDYETYMVKTGDTLWEISRKYHTTIEELMRINNLSQDTIYPTQILFVPRKNHSSGNDCYYQTVPGDTLGVIFEKLNLDSKCLKKYANLLEVLVEPNQVIELVNNHKVKYSGESVEEFLANNNLSSTDLVKLNRWLQPGSDVIVG